MRYGQTSLTISDTSDVPNPLWRSPVLATSPFETLTKTLLICSTSSKFVSLENTSVAEYSLLIQDKTAYTPVRHSWTLFL